MGFTDDGGNAETLTSAETATVAAAALAARSGISPLRSRNVVVKHRGTKFEVSLDASAGATGDDVT